MAPIVPERLRVLIAFEGVGRRALGDALTESLGLKRASGRGRVDRVLAGQEFVEPEVRKELGRLLRFNERWLGGELDFDPTGFHPEHPFRERDQSSAAPLPATLADLEIYVFRRKVWKAVARDVKRLEEEGNLDTYLPSSYHALARDLTSLVSAPLLFHLLTAPTDPAKALPSLPRPKAQDGWVTATVHLVKGITMVLGPWLRGDPGVVPDFKRIQAMVTTTEYFRMGLRRADGSRVEVGESLRRPR